MTEIGGNEYAYFPRFCSINLEKCIRTVEDCSICPRAAVYRENMEKKIK